jgi:hypothetical protein
MDFVQPCPSASFQVRYSHIQYPAARVNVVRLFAKDFQIIHIMEGNDDTTFSAIPIPILAPALSHAQIGDIFSQSDLRESVCEISRNFAVVFTVVQ